METIEISMEIIIAVYAITTIIALLVGYFARKYFARRQKNTLEAKVAKALSEAKEERRQILLKAKDEALKIREIAKQEEIERQRQFLQFEKRLDEREKILNRQLEELENKANILRSKVKEIRKAKEEIAGVRREQIIMLEKIAKLTRKEAEKKLLDNIAEEIKEDLKKRIHKLEMMEREVLEKKAKEILSTVVQKVAVAHTAETTTTVVDLPSDDMKGRIIGREGRNIRTIEELTGTEIVVDDTPGAIVVSGFSPVRRQIAKLALDKLISDGRIHPARIEEAVSEAKERINAAIKEAGEAVVYDLGVTGLDPRLVLLLGRLRFRTSYGQNVLKHSLEVAHLSALLAAELGADVNIAKKAGLLHDIGKAVDHEIKGSHVEIGLNILKKFGVDEEVIKAMKSHHEEYPYETLESVIIQTADAISASRPGARKDTYENYIQRLDELEKVANSFKGVEKSYAIQAGHEIRIFVSPENISDLQAKKMAREIADKIEEELKYPGEIKVNVIRETRVIEVAR